MADHDDLPERIAQGEEVAFYQFCSRYGRVLYCYFRRWGIHDAAARDLTSDSLTEIALKVKTKFKFGTNFNAWVFKVASRIALTWFRKHKGATEIPLEGDLATPDNESETSVFADAAAVQKAIASLDPIDQEIIHLRYDGLETPTFPAIAAELTAGHGYEIKEFTVRKRHGRALHRVEGLLKRPRSEEQS